MRTKWGWFPKEDAFGGGEFLLSLTTKLPDTSHNAEFTFATCFIINVLHLYLFASLQLESPRSADHGLL